MPTRDTPWPDGTPCWIDYGAADLDATKAFYATLLGWEYTGGEAEFGGYLNATKNGQQTAGLAPQQDPNDPPRWTTYFATSDAAATAGRIRDAGGTVLVEPMEVGPMGTMVIALDPQGNPFGLWQSGTTPVSGSYNEPGSLAWNEAMVDDTAAAKTFYATVFGFTFEQMRREAGEGIDYSTFNERRNPLGGLGGHRSEHAEGLADVLLGAPPPTRPSPRPRQRAARSRCSYGHPVRAVRRRRGPVGRPVRGHADPAEPDRRGRVAERAGRSAGSWP